jgi:hypothetical protein
MEENAMWIIDGLPSGTLPTLPYSFTDGCITPKLTGNPAAASYSTFTKLSCIYIGTNTTKDLGFVKLVPDLGAGGLG